MSESSKSEQATTWTPPERFQPVFGDDLEYAPGAWEIPDNHPSQRERMRAQAERLVARAPGVVAFLRDNFRDDGAEGETVHLACAIIDELLRRDKDLRIERDRTAMMDKMIASLRRERDDLLTRVEAAESCLRDWMSAVESEDIGADARAMERARKLLTPAEGATR